MDYFLQSVLFIPWVACIALGALGASIGSIVVLKRQSLLGETLSHACYPGLAIGIWLSATSGNDILYTVALGFIFACLAYWSVEHLIKGYRISTDAALCAVLASYFAFGLLFISAAQNSAPALSKKLHALLLGQAATISEGYAVICVFLCIVISGFLALFSRALRADLFDPIYAHLMGISHSTIQYLLAAAIVVTLILGAKVMGVVLMSSLLIFPSVTARLWCSSFSSLLVLSGILGAVSCSAGLFASHYLGSGMPTGPSISVLLSFLFIASYLFAPCTGVFVRAWKRIGFRSQCAQENLLKAIWRLVEKSGRSRVLVSEVSYSTALDGKQVRLLAKKLRRKGFITFENDEITLEDPGVHAARKLVRLHRLWELYLVEFCNMAKDRVHPSAEEMEHILTPQIEAELDRLLRHPKVDPHKQPIPRETV